MLSGFFNLVVNNQAQCEEIHSVWTTGVGATCVCGAAYEQMGKRENKDFLDITWLDLESWAGSKIVSRGRSYQRSEYVSDLWKYWIHYRNNRLSGPKNDLHGSQVKPYSLPYHFMP